MKKFMCAKNQCRCFLLVGCVTYTATIAAIVLNVIYIVNGITNSIGVWPIIGAILWTIAIMFIGSGLGLLFQSYGIFLKRLSFCKCSNHSGCEE